MIISRKDIWNPRDKEGFVRKVATLRERENMANLKLSYAIQGQERIS